MSDVLRQYDYLGRMLLMTIREESFCPYDDFVASWEKHKLPAAHMPSKRTPEDAFRRATPRKIWHDQMTLLDYKGGQRLEAGAGLQVVLVYSKDSRKRVDIHHANRAVVYLSDDEVRTLPLAPLLDTEQAFLDKVVSNYELRLSHVDGSQLRSALTKVLVEASAISYRDGSYLVPNTGFEHLEGVLGLVQDMQQWSRKMHVAWDIPYIDTPKTRDYMRQALADHLERSAAAIIDEISKLKKDHKRALKVTRRDTLMRRLHGLEGVVRNFEIALNEKLTQHRDQLAQAVVEAASA